MKFPLQNLEKIPFLLGPCLYAVEMDGDMVKIGFSENPRHRISLLTTAVVRDFGCRALRFHISAPMANKNIARRAEKTALSLARAKSKSHHKQKEFFYGLPFFDAIQFINQAINRDTKDKK